MAEILRFSTKTKQQPCRPDPPFANRLPFCHPDLGLRIARNPNFPPGFALFDLTRGVHWRGQALTHKMLPLRKNEVVEYSPYPFLGRGEARATLQRVGGTVVHTEGGSRGYPTYRDFGEGGSRAYPNYPFFGRRGGK